MSTPRKLSLASYVKRRNGVAMSAPGSMKNMLTRSFGAGNFAKFWQHWNPIFGYYLGRNIFSPLKRWLTPSIALILTFVFCGALHDAVTIIVRGNWAFFFTPWFLAFGICVVINSAMKINYSHAPFMIRVTINVLIIGACLSFALLFKI